jgi:two-component system, cell cycle sensor histidine kinase and response regulator CckA
MTRTQTRKVALYALPSNYAVHPPHENEAENKLNSGRSDISWNMLAEQLPALTWTTDMDLRLVTLGGADVAQLDGLPHDAVGRKLGEVFPVQEKLNSPERAAALALGGRAVSFEFVHGPAHYFGMVEPLFDEEGALRGTIAVALNICDRRQAEEERSRSVLQRLAERREQALRRLTGGVAHNFNNLLSVVLGSAYLALRELTPDSPARPYVAQIEAAAQAAAEQAGLMLFYAQKTPALPQGLDLAAVMHELEPHIQSTVSANVAVLYDLDTALPQVQADRDQLHHLIMTLIFNASEAIGDSDGTIRIRTQAVHADAAFLQGVFGSDAVPEGNYAWLQVSDTGCGMDEETRVCLFEPYFSTKFTGRGLGLASAQGIVRTHHGAMAVASKPGFGTTFHVLLPLAELASAEENITSAATV